MNVKHKQYKSASGHMVDLYETDKGAVTVVQGDITVYDNQGDMKCGAPSLEAALKFIEE